jgi:hypothetical protein
MWAFAAVSGLQIWVVIITLPWPAGQLAMQKHDMFATTIP